MVICFLTTDHILGSAGLKDMTKGVRSVWCAYTLCHILHPALPKISGLQQIRHHSSVCHCGLAAFNCICLEPSLVLVSRRDHIWIEAAASCAFYKLTKNLTICTDKSWLLDMSTTGKKSFYFMIIIFLVSRLLFPRKKVVTL